MTENRRHPRIKEKVETRVRIQSAPGLPDLEGREFKCSSGDISLCGVRLHLDHPVPARSLVEVEIALGDPPAKYRFTGTTVWAEPPKTKGRRGSGQTSQIGIQLNISDNPMTGSWKKALKKLKGQA